MEVPIEGPSWFATYVTTRHEKAVVERLNNRSIESYLPLYRTVHCWNKRKVWVELPLFPSYVFVRIPAPQRMRVIEVAGVVHIVSFNGVPASIPDQEMETLRTALGLRQAQPHPYICPGSRVRIQNGPLQGLQGVVVRQNSQTKVIVSVDFLLRSIAVELKPSDLEFVKSANPVIGSYSEMSANQLWR